MPNIRIVTAGAILIAMAGAAAAQSDTSQAPNQDPGKPVSLLQILLKPSTPDTANTTEAPTGATETSDAPDATVPTRVVHRHWHHRRYAHKKSHPAQNDDAAATAPNAPSDNAQANAASPPSDANSAVPAPTLFDASATALLPGTQTAPPASFGPSAMVVDGRTVQISSQDEINALDLAAGDSAANNSPQPFAGLPGPAADTSPAADASTAASKSDDNKLGDNKPADTPAVAFAQRDNSDNSRDIWYEDLLATLGSILAAASVAWFLIGRAPPRRNGSERMLAYETEPLRR